MTKLPPLALSVRQPWAWAILHGGKVIENRSLGAIRAGNMKPGRIALHAASGMTRKEYDWAVWRLDRHGVSCPRPDDLPRRAIIGSVDVTEIITKSESEWFGGQAGLVLKDPHPCAPIPAAGALGYFSWHPAGTLAKALPWMIRWDHPNNDPMTGDLFDAAPSYATPPPKPFGTSKS